MLTKTKKSKISTEDNQITCKIKFRLNFTIYLFFQKLSNNYKTTISLGKICYLKKKYSPPSAFFSTCRFKQCELGNEKYEIE